MGDWRDRVEDRAAVLRAVPEDQRLRLLVRGLRLLRGDTEQGLLRTAAAAAAAGFGAGEQANEVLGAVLDRLLGDWEEGDGGPARGAAQGPA